jgi:hypothetical protein
MNERVKELALKCGAWNQVYGENRLLINEYFNYEKFYELVVKECADHILESSDRHRKEYFADKVLELL